MRIIDALTGVSGLGINTDKTVLVSAGDLAPSKDWVRLSSPWTDLQVSDRCLYLGVMISDVSTLSSRIIPIESFSKRIIEAN